MRDQLIQIRDYFLSTFNFMSAHPRLAQISRIIRWILTISIFGFVFWRLSTIGWRDVIRAIPISFGTVILFSMCYAIQPFADYTIYRRLWKIPLSTLPALFRKRALNEGVMDYFGEIYLIDWGNKSRIDSLGRVASTVKDVSILSIISSHLLTLAVVIYLLSSDALEKLLIVDPQIKFHIYIACGFVISLLVGTLALQRKVLALAGADLRFVAIIHAIRVFAFFGGSILLWSVAVPSVHFADWFLFMAAQLLASRLPLVPNRDLVMAGIGVALAPSLGTSAANVAGLFIGVSSAYLITNLLVVLATQNLSALPASAPKTNLD
jgi:hypothetical protein